MGSQLILCYFSHYKLELYVSGSEIYNYGSGSCKLFRTHPDPQHWIVYYRYLPLTVDPGQGKAAACVGTRIHKTASKSHICSSPDNTPSPSPMAKRVRRPPRKTSAMEAKIALVERFFTQPVNAKGCEWKLKLCLDSHPLKNSSGFSKNPSH